MKENPWITQSSKIRYENPWIRVKEHKVLNAAKHRGIYGTVHFKNLAIGIIPVDKNRDTYLIGQYRYPLKEYSWEIPAGGGRIGVLPMLTAKRELWEETGIRAGRFKQILKLHLSNSVTDEVAHIFLAFDLKQFEAHPEENEVLEIRRVSLKEAHRMVVSGKITDAMSVAGILRASELLS